MFTLVQLSVTGHPIDSHHIQEVTCYREEGRWRVSLDHYLSKVGSGVCKEVAPVADELISWIGRRRNRFTVLLHTLPFLGARVLELDQLCAGPGGGAFYRLLAPNTGNQRLWVCDTSLLVLGDLPQHIFFRVKK